jgi:hypothetical protein
MGGGAGQDDGASEMLDRSTPMGRDSVSVCGELDHIRNVHFR